MASGNLYDVVYEYGDKVMRHDLVLAANGSEPTISAVLAANVASAPSGNGRGWITGITVKIIAIRNASVPGAILS